jgi:hypothetical protein
MGIVFASHPEAVHDGLPARRGLGGALGPEPSGPGGNPAVEGEPGPPAGEELEGLAGQLGIGRQGVAHPGEQHRPALRRGPAPARGADQPPYPVVAPGAEQGAQHETRDQPGAQPQGGEDGGEGPAPAPMRPRDTELHAVNLIPLPSPENRERRWLPSPDRPPASPERD